MAHARGDILTRDGTYLTILVLSPCGRYARVWLRALDQLQTVLTRAKQRALRAQAGTQAASPCQGVLF
jgi:hypothetical protein